MAKNKHHLQKEEYTMQFLLGFGFSDCEFHMYYANSQIYC